MQHIFDAVKVMLDSDVSIVPVLDMQRRYMGCITRADLVRVLGEITSSTEPGDMIILEIERHNYSLTQIASIIEQHSAKVINMFLSPVPLSYNIYVNLKITGGDTSAVVLSLERHGYRIAYIFADNDLLRDSKDRFDALMRFINL
jgi:CBS domain-containing protein